MQVISPSCMFYLYCMGTGVARPMETLYTLQLQPLEGAIFFPGKNQSVQLCPTNSEAGNSMANPSSIKIL